MKKTIVKKFAIKPLVTPICIRLTPLFVESQNDPNHRRKAINVISTKEYVENYQNYKFSNGKA